MTPHLRAALFHLENGEVGAARDVLRTVAANPAAFPLSERDEWVFGMACDLCALPATFPPQVRADLAHGLLANTLGDAVARVRDPLGEDPRSPEVRRALRIHAPLLSAAAEVPRRVAARPGPVRAAASPPLDGVSVWTLLVLAMFLARACHAFVG